ncbi:MAG TPA: DUF4412 domain-containing protein [Nitrospira sp.]|nr:DUF4412 domain-containing protein [Nitrospira sp.]
MQRRWPIVVATVALSLAPLSARAGEFEGVLHMTTSHADTGMKSAMDWYLKGDKGRMEMSRGEGRTSVMIFDATTRTMQMAMPEQKSYMEFSLAGERGEHLTEAFENQLVERTGKTETIAGYSCEIWRITDKDQHRLKSRVCVAKGFGKAATFWADPKDARRSSQPGWMRQLAEEGGFAIRSMQYGEAGKESMRMEVTSIDKKSLDAGLFAFPADWAKQDMSAIQERMKAMREQKGQGAVDLSKMLDDMKKRKSARRGAGEAGQQPDMQEIMKQLGEAMKKPQVQPQGGQ